MSTLPPGKRSDLDDDEVISVRNRAAGARPAERDRVSPSGKVFQHHKIPRRLCNSNIRARIDAHVIAGQQRTSPELADGEKVRRLEVALQAQYRLPINRQRQRAGLESACVSFQSVLSELLQARPRRYTVVFVELRNSGAFDIDSVQYRNQYWFIVRNDDCPRGVISCSGERIISCKEGDWAEVICISQETSCVIGRIKGLTWAINDPLPPVLCPSGNSFSINCCARRINLKAHWKDPPYLDVNFRS